MTFCGSEKPVPLNLLQWLLALLPIGNMKKAGDKQQNAEVLFSSPQSLKLKLKSEWTLRCSTSSAGLHYHPMTPKLPFLGYNISIWKQMTCLSHLRIKPNRQVVTIPQSDHRAAQRLGGPAVAKVRTPSGIRESVGAWELVRRQGAFSSFPKIECGCIIYYFRKLVQEWIAFLQVCFYGRKQNHLLHKCFQHPTT